MNGYDATTRKEKLLMCNMCMCMFEGGRDFFV
jgi:hypothetical protein